MLTREEFVGPLILLKEHIEYSRKRDLIRMPETISLLYNVVSSRGIFYNQILYIYTAGYG